MSRWQLSGYAEPGLFPGAPRCRFRLTHVRDDGLVVMTLGDQRDPGGRLAPIHGGFFFATYVGRVPPNGSAEVSQIATYTSHAAASEGHAVTLDVWEDLDP